MRDCRGISDGASKHEVDAANHGEVVRYRDTVITSAPHSALSLPTPSSWETVFIMIGHKELGYVGRRQGRAWVEHIPLDFLKNFTN